MRRPSFFLPFLGSTAHRLRRRRRRRPAWWAPFSLVTLLLSAVGASATTVVPPTFSELVAESELIARGTVVDVTSRWVERPSGRVIQTFVTFALENQLKGAAAKTITLQFLGGTVGSETTRVTGMPEFMTGDTEILFVRGNGTHVCPLARFGHGRYRVQTGSDHRRFIAREDGEPLETTDDIQRPIHERANGHAGSAPGNGLAPEEFETQIADEVAHRSR